MTTHYTPTEQGGMRFTSKRRPGDVRIPNYVYDLWMPLIGIDAIGVYAVYCRLEREGTVKAMSQDRMAQEMRIGVNKLNKINDLLQRYGFIRVRKPEGHERLMHWTTEIEVLDPPTTVSADTIEELKHPKGYEPLCPWLIQMDAPEQPNGISGTTNQSLDEQPNGGSKVESPVFASSVFAPSGVEEDAASGDSPPSPQEPERPAKEPQERLEKMRERLGSDPFSVARNCEQARAKVEHPDFADPSHDVDQWDRPFQYFCVSFRPGLQVEQLPEVKRKNSTREIERLAGEVHASPEQAAEAMPLLALLEPWLVGPTCTPFKASWAEGFQNVLISDRETLQAQIDAKGRSKSNGSEPTGVNAMMELMRDEYGEDVPLGFTL